jgi:lipoprotein signal peptidase
MLRVFLAIMIAAHGIGHVLFLAPMLSIADWGQSTRSWLLGDTTGAHLLGGLLWLITIVGFGASAFGLFNQQPWWRNVAVISAGLSTVGLILFWVSPVRAPVLSALIFNFVVMGALVIVHWPSSEAVGA